MPNTYQICEVTVTLPPLGSTTTDGCGNKIKHGDKRRVHLYAVKPDWCQGSTFEGFIVGWFTHAGYSESQHKRSQRIMMPDGYKLVAISVDEYGLPKSRDSLPVHFSGGYVSNLEDVDATASAEYSVKMGISIENNDKATSFFEEAVRKAVQKECQPGGAVWRMRCR
ncbi:hypothetical protein U0026_09270 [Kluyvera intermedia]|nr:hypothetical protein [Kluyvera intermedia]WQD31400.1 hypothetical protein U0026_09270 [Kluyvera intermedia]VDZ82716.1 Uncharacterised protein [Kluyvera intermedia]